MLHHWHRVWCRQVYRVWRHAGTLVVLMFSEVLLCARCSRVNSEALGSGSCYYLVVANAFDLGLGCHLQKALQLHARVALVLVCMVCMVPA